MYYFIDKGYKIKVVNPYHARQIKEIEDNSQTKTDIKDSIHIVKVGACPRIASNTNISLKAHINN